MFVPVSTDKLFVRPVAARAKYTQPCEGCGGPVPVAHVRATSQGGTPIMLCEPCVLGMIVALTQALEQDSMRASDDVPSWSPARDFEIRVDRMKDSLRHEVIKTACAITGRTLAGMQIVERLDAVLDREVSLLITGRAVHLITGR